MTLGETDGSRRAKTVRLTVQEFASLSVGRLVSQSPSVSVAQPTCQSVSQSLVSSSTRQSVNQSVSQSLVNLSQDCQSTNLSVCQMVKNRELTLKCKLKCYVNP